MAATISYPGCQLVPVQPAAWQQATKVGWDDTDPLAQAYRNGQQDVTGYRFTSGPAYNLGLLISNPPVIAFSAANPAAARPVTPQVVADFFGSLQLLNLDQAAGQQQPMRAGASRDGNGPTVPLLQQNAYVIGASLDFVSQD